MLKFSITVNYSTITLLSYMDTLISILFAATLIFFLLKLNGERDKNANLPPSPPKLPIIGNLHQLGALPHRSLRSLAEKHGPLMLLNLGQIPTLIVSSAELAKEILESHDPIFANRPSLTAPKRLFYGGTDIAFAPYGEYWRQVKKIGVVELLTKKRVNSFGWVMEEEVGLMIEKISQSCSTGTAVNITELFSTLSGGTVTRAAFGKKYEGEGEEKRNKFADLAAELTELLGSFFIGDYFPSLAWVDVLTGMDGRLEKNSSEMDAFLDQVIDEHLLKRKAKGYENLEHKDLVDVLLHVQEEFTLGIHLTKNNLKAVILDIFAAGTDTVAITIDWTMAELLKHPKVMEKAQAEIREVVGKNGRVKVEDLHRLNYLKLIVKEILRLHAAVPLLTPRETTRNVMVGGYHVPARTRVFINAWAIGRDPKSWENAEEFLPERFASDPVDFKGKHFQLIPFGAGRRSCPGMSFAISLIELALANLLHRFNWELPKGLAKDDLDMSEAVGITVNRKFPLELVPHLFSYESY